VDESEAGSARFLCARWHEFVTKPAQTRHSFSGSMVAVTATRSSRPEAPPTVRQVYALAAALCERMGEEFPKNRADASEVIERLRTENGHPTPRLEDTARR
jgi:hypothetical protein